MAAKGKSPSKTERLHRLFAKEYVINFSNGMVAYKKVYPKVKDSTAKVQASKLLTKPNVQTWIKEEYERIWKDKDTELERSKTYSMIHALGESEISEVVDLETGTLKVKDFSEIPLKARQAIQSIKFKTKTNQYGTDEELEVKMHSKQAALELRAKIQQMIQEKVEMTGEIVIKPAEKPDNDGSKD
jgi:phage terminase small subunit